MTRVFLFIFVFLAMLVTAAENFSSWQKQMPITFSGYTPTGNETLTNFPALVILSNTSAGAGFNYNDFLSPSYGDLRFTASDKTTPLNFEVEKWDVSGNSYVWVRVPELTGTNTQICAFWRKGEVSAPPCTTNGDVWTNNYAAVWHLKEISGQFLDSTVNGNHGADNVSATNNDGVVDGGQQFNGTSDYINAGGSATLKPSSFSYECWMKETADQHTRVFMGCYENPNTGIVLGIKDGVNNVLKFRINGNQLESPALIAGIWYHIAGTYSGGISALYVNGTRIVSAVGYSDPLVPAGSTNFNIGRWNGGSSQHLNGWMDEVRVSKLARSSNWVWACYMNMASNGTFNTYAPPALGGVNGTIIYAW